MWLPGRGKLFLSLKKKWVEAGEFRLGRNFLELVKLTLEQGL